MSLSGGRAHRRVELDANAVRAAGIGPVSIGLVVRATFVNGPIDDIDYLTEEVEEGPVAPEKLPLVE